MSDSLAPALDNGLDILEMLASADRPLRFGEIVSSLTTSKASTIRLLKTLQARDYAAKNELGGYIAGPRMSALARPGLEAETLRRASTAVLTRLSEATGNTALVLHWDGRRIQCLNKVVHQAAASMQEVGTIMIDLDGTPWGWFFYETLDQQSQLDADRAMRDAAAFHRKRAGRRQKMERAGFTYDDQQVFKSLRRIAAPVHNASGAIVGAVGIGGNPITIRDSQIRKFGRRVVDAAAEISRALGCRRREDTGEE